jgi:hypothetical protein
MWRRSEFLKASAVPGPTKQAINNPNSPAKPQKGSTSNSQGRSAIKHAETAAHPIKIPTQ